MGTADPKIEQHRIDAETARDKAGVDPRLRNSAAKSRKLTERWMKLPASRPNKFDDSPKKHDCFRGSIARLSTRPARKGKRRVRPRATLSAPPPKLSAPTSNR